MRNTTFIDDDNCPFWNNWTFVCRVSFSRAAPGSGHCLTYCTSDDHDNCPLYLAEALRRSRIRPEPPAAVQYPEGRP